MKTTLLKKLLQLALLVTIIPLIMMIFYYIYLNKMIENDIIYFQKKSLNNIAYEIKQSINNPLKLEQLAKHEHTNLPKLRIFDKDMKLISYNFNIKNIDKADQKYNRKVFKQHFKKMFLSGNEHIVNDEKNNFLIKPIVSNNKIVAYVTSDYKSIIYKKMLLLNQTFIYLLFVNIFIVFIVIIFIVILALKLLQPLDLLIDGIKKVTAGNLSFTIDNTSNDEIGKVIDAFNDMTRKHGELKIMATQDGLTGLCNHRLFYMAFKNEISRGIRYSRPTSMLLIDIDHFKNVNDTYGHIAGDEILIGLSQRLMKRARSTDHVCRYGGEEFAIILVETDISTAKSIAEELRLLIAKEPFLIGGKQCILITVSVGVSEYREEAKDASSIFSNADKALYRAKKNGRNQVCVCEKSTL